MKRINFRVGFVIFTGLFIASGVLAQERVLKPSVADKYVISAKAGGVNFVEGTVIVARSNGTSGSLLKGDRIEIGDSVSTDANGRVEVLMNPGSYLRLGGNSSLEFKTTALDDLQIKLDRGSAMFEVFATDKFKVRVITPKGQVAMIESGIYRIDLRADGTGTIAVTEGKAEVGVTTVKAGRTASIGTETVAVAKFDRGKRDDLAQWSRSRAKDLAKMTSSLRNNDVRNSLLSSFNRGRWGLFDSFGLWVYNPFGGAYCFLPFGRDWYSPYGYGYGSGLYWFDFPWPRYPTNVAKHPPANPIDSPPADLGRRKPVPDTDPPFAAMDGEQKQRDLGRRREINDSESPFPGFDKRFDPPTQHNFPPERIKPPPMSAPPVFRPSDLPPPPQSPEKP